jgi:hypothetical protein
MKKLLLALTLFCSAQLSAQVVLGDTLTPLRVVQKYISPNGFPEKMRHFCCEMYQEWMAPQTLGQQLGAGVKREAKLLYQDSSKAVVTVWLHDSVTSMDVYFYLQHRGVWTVYAIRSLVMKDFAKNELKRLDSIPVADRGKSYAKKHGHTWQFDYDNAVLWGAPDTVLADNFYRNKAAFEKLEKYRQKRYPLKPGDTTYADAQKDKKIRKQTAQLLVREIMIDKFAPGAVLYHIGGVVDNSVGYLYQPDPKKLPAISAGYFILIRPLGNGWYLYKTT